MTSISTGLNGLRSSYPSSKNCKRKSLTKIFRHFTNTIVSDRSAATFIKLTFEVQIVWLIFELTFCWKCHQNRRNVFFCLHQWGIVYGKRSKHFEMLRSLSFYKQLLSPNANLRWNGKTDMRSIILTCVVPRVFPDNSCATSKVAWCSRHMFSNTQLPLVKWRCSVPLVPFVDCFVWHGVLLELVYFGRLRLSIYQNTFLS